MNYDFQECPRINKEAFQDLEVDDIDFVRIVVMGPVGAGKTSFVGENRFFILKFLVRFDS